MAPTQYSYQLQVYSMATQHLYWKLITLHIDHRNKSSNYLSPTVITTVLTTFPMTLFINLSDLEPPGIMHEVHIQEQPQNQRIINQLLDKRAPACNVWRRPRGGSSVHLSQPRDCHSVKSPAPSRKGIWKTGGHKSSRQTTGTRQHGPS